MLEAPQVSVNMNDDNDHLNVPNIESEVRLCMPRLKMVNQLVSMISTLNV